MPLKSFKNFEHKARKNCLNFPYTILESVTDQSYNIEYINELLTSLLFVGTTFKLMEATTENLVKTVISKVPITRDVLEDYRIYLNGKHYTINWDGSLLKIFDEDDKEIYREEDIEDSLKLKKVLIEFFTNYIQDHSSEEDEDMTMGGTPETEEEVESPADLDIDEMIDTEEDEVKRRKLLNLKNYLIPKYIDVFFTNKEKKHILIQTLLRHIKNENIGNLKSSEKREVIKAFFNIMDTILDDRNLSSLVTTNVSFSTLYEERSKRKNKRKKSIVDSVSKKLEYLFRLGLTDKRFINRVKRALTMDKVTATSIKIYRDIILDLISDIIEYIEKDAVIYNKMRMLLTKKGTINETVLDWIIAEKAPPISDSLKKRILTFYGKGKEEEAYATMWKIYNNIKNKKEKEENK